MTTTTLVIVWCACLTLAIAIVAVQLCRVGTRQARRRDEAAFKYGYCCGIGFEGTSEMDAAWSDYQRAREGTR